MKDFISNPWTSALIVLVTQFIFIFFRTLNVSYNSEGRIVPTIITGNVIGISWLVSIALGANAILELMWQPILSHLIGGTIGTIYAFKFKKKIDNIRR